MVKENYHCKETYWGLVGRKSGARPEIFCRSKKLSEKLRTINRALDEEPVLVAIGDSVETCDPHMEEPMQRRQRDRRPPQVLTYYGPGLSFERPVGNVSYVYGARPNPINCGVFYAYPVQNYPVQH